MKKSLLSRLGILLFVTLMASGCATATRELHKAPADRLVVSVSDAGLNKWTDIGADDIRLGESNVFVTGKAGGSFMFGGVLVQTASLKNEKDAGRISNRLSVELSPHLRPALTKAAHSLGLPDPSISTEHAESAAIQIIPLVQLTFLADGRLTFSAQIQTRFLDDKGQRPKRTYAYLSRLVLPADDSPNSWTANDKALFKNQLDRAFFVLSDVMLRDRRGDFLAEALSPTPNVIPGEGGRGFSKVRLAEFDGLLLTYSLALRKPMHQFLYVEDMTDPKSWR